MFEISKLTSVAALVEVFQMRLPLQYHGKPLTPYQESVVRYVISSALTDDDAGSLFSFQSLSKANLISLNWQYGHFVAGDRDEFTNCSFFDALEPERWYQKPSEEGSEAQA